MKRLILQKVQRFNTIKAWNKFISENERKSDFVYKILEFGDKDPSLDAKISKDNPIIIELYSLL